MSKNTYIKIPVDKELLQQVEAIAKHDSRSVNQTALSLICKGLEKITKEKAEKSKKPPKEEQRTNPQKA